MKKLNWIGNLILIAIVAGSLTGCTAVRLMEVSTGIGVNKTVIGTEIQTTQKKVKKEVSLIFTPMGNGLGLRLQYSPHYEIQTRSVMKYEGKSDIFSTLIGIAELGTFVFATVQWVKLAEGPEDPRDWSVIKENWPELKTWQKVALIGIPSDFLLWAVTKGFRPTKRTPWAPSGDTEPGEWAEIPNHPITISLPQFGYTGIHQTNADGQLTLSPQDLINKIPGQKLSPILRENAIRIDASARFEGQQQQQSFTVDRSSALFQVLYQEADKRQ